MGACGLKGDLGRGGDTPLIVNGEDADVCEWRWQVGLRSSGTRGIPWCGGMLIDPQWVLTAAHCVTRPNFDVVAGEHTISNATGNEQVRAAAEVISHPYYNSRTMHYDVALVKLASPMAMNGCAGTVCLPGADEEVAPGTKCWITGWGTLRSGGSQPDVMQEAEVTVISNDDCSGKFAYKASELHSSMLCAQGVNANGSISDACQGDSGGPLVCESAPGVWTLHGATSWGYGCAGRTYPGIWARVTEAATWIEEVLGGNGGFQPSTPAPPRCPDFAAGSAPDSNGDCRCAAYMYCSADGGESYNCPKSPEGESSLVSRLLFEHTCTDCQCYHYFR